MIRTVFNNSIHSGRTNEYEYKNLKFLDTLGEGAFGKVLKAEAAGLKCPQGSQMVAVKMCRGSLGNLCLVLDL